MSVHSHFLALIFNLNYMDVRKQVSFCKRFILSPGSWGRGVGSTGGEIDLYDFIYIIKTPLMLGNLAP